MVSPAELGMTMGQHSQFMGKGVINEWCLENRQDMLRGTMIEKAGEVNLKPIAFTSSGFSPDLLKV